MAVLFSAVTVAANSNEVELLVSGIPREFDDLEGWTAFDNFTEDIDEETEVAVMQKRTFTAKVKYSKQRRKKLHICMSVLKTTRTFSMTVVRTYMSTG